MTRDEADELMRDLERVRGIQIIRTELRPHVPDEAQLYVWSEYTNACHSIVNSRLFRDAVAAGLTPVLPRGALDRR